VGLGEVSISTSTNEGSGLNQVETSVGGSGNSVVSTSVNGKTQTFVNGKLVHNSGNGFSNNNSVFTSTVNGKTSTFVNGQPVHSDLECSFKTSCYHGICFCDEKAVLIDECIKSRMPLRSSRVGAHSSCPNPVFDPEGFSQCLQNRIKSSIPRIPSRRLVNLCIEEVNSQYEY